MENASLALPEGSAPELDKKISENFSAQGLMGTLGAELVHVARGEVQIALRSRRELSQQHGYVHAGALTSIVDSACGYAALTLAPPEHDVLTVEFKVNLLRPAVGKRFLAIGKVVKSGEILTVSHGEVFVEHGSRLEAVALMQATIMYVSNNA